MRSSPHRCWRAPTARTRGCRRSAPARRGSGRSTTSSGGPTAHATALEAQSPSWALTVPTEELREAEHVATVAGRRLLLVGGEAAALLVAFAVLAAGALRRDLASARRRLTWHGARRWQGALLTGTECAAVGFGGALAGWIVGGVGGAVAAAVADAPVGSGARGERPLADRPAPGPRDRRRRRRRDRGDRLARAGPPGAAGDARPRGGRRTARGPGDRPERCGGRRRPRLGRRGPCDAPRAPGPRRLRGRRRSLSPAARRRAPGGSAWSKGQCPPRRRVARPVGRRRRDRGGVPRARRRARRPRRDVPVDAPDGRARPGGLRRADRRRRPRGPPLARPRPAGRATRAVRRDPGRRGGPSGDAAHRERRPRGLRLRRHGARRASGGAPRGAALAGRLGRHARRRRQGGRARRLRRAPWADPAGLRSRARGRPRASVVPRAPRAARRPVPDTRPGRRRPRRALDPPGTSPARCAGLEARGARARRAASDRPRRRRRDRAARSHGTPRGGRLAGRLDRRGWGHRGGPLDRSRHAGDVRRHRSAAGPRPPAAADGRRSADRRRDARAR